MMTNILFKKICLGFPYHLIRFYLDHLLAISNKLRYYKRG